MVDVHESQSVVVGVDGSEKAAEAVRLAAAEAAARGLSLHVVHATALDGRSGRRPDPADQLLLDAGQDVLDEAIAQVAAQVPRLCVTSTLSRDSAVRALLGAAGADGIIAVGSRGLGGFTALLLGSVGLRLAARVTGPLVVVRGAPEPVRTGVVLAAVRDERDLDALRFAAETADRRKSSLRVLSCYRFYQYAGSMVPMLDDLTEVPEEQMSATSRLLGFLGDEFPALTVTADAVRAPSTAGALVEASGHAELLVVGARRPAHAIGAPLGHVAHAVLHHAQCPVAMVPCRGPHGEGG
ncbi:universal stress protein [Streptomyces sp. 142MFCol3.1]|uniref:universal stress protein n=1 Tax=Streptomyces sp. 142MFCol3.1 TaxID=1172179 RepID=UPI000416EEB0|nr:universal stress protein [Streptomyces sp. 142MFCol3.1]